MTEQQTMSRLRAPILGGATVGLVLAAVLGIQHLRHGWPFSLHHLVPATAPLAAAPAPVDAHAAHARAVVELDDVGLERGGVRLEAARAESIAQRVRATVTVVPDEARVVHLHARISGWVEVLHATTTGQDVRAGAPLVGIFSQELYASQVEYLSALQSAGAGPRSAIVDGARSRLRVLGMGDAEVRDIERSGKPHRLVTLTAPSGGVLLRRPVAPGSAVDPSTEIVTLADLSRVWAIAEVPESEAAGIAPGMPAQLDFAAAGKQIADAKVEFVAPTLTERTRTLKVRFSLDNRDGALRPGLYGTASFAAAPREVVTVPRDAVVDTGERQHVFVATAPGRLEPRTVTLGTRMADRVEIRSGLAAGENVVAAGVFLIDSESRLRASGGAGGHAHGAAGREEVPEQKAKPEHSGH
ncbi:MAG: efflux RND transporter periplasmic adaptor subunit [Sinimarinibacterium sp.]|jgi:Cu(I)/Ag(I) efflux system membrane fusion protein